METSLTRIAGIFAGVSRLSLAAIAPAAIVPAAAQPAVGTGPTPTVLGAFNNWRSSTDRLQAADLPCASLRAPPGPRAPSAPDIYLAMVSAWPSRRIKGEVQIVLEAIR